MRILLMLLAVWASLGAAAPSPARADAPLHSYALVVGSNRGGAGQSALSFAEQDAERMADMLVELGRTPRDHVTLLRQPSAKTLEQALAQLAARIRQHAGHGERSQVLFYYSGHAKARGLSLADQELSLESLRSALTSLPSTLTVVVLDACQSGAFSGVKGASPAADFSISSVEELHSQGIAVMASSTAAELSQESPELGSSYFSHHLLVALRGAGDGNADGRVSLDEAYGYAYQHTLSDTARTQVGTQHATLETDIKGRGDVPLSYPVDADAQLALPRDMSGRVMVQRSPRGTVVAEIVKAAGTPLVLALPQGPYDIVVRSADGQEARGCQLVLKRGESHTFNVLGCPRMELPTGLAKGEEEERTFERWFLEGGVALGSVPHDAYNKTVEQFRFQEDNAGDVLSLEGAIGVSLLRHLSLVSRFDRLEGRRYSRSLQGPDGESRDERFNWVTRAVSLGARARLPFFKEWVVGMAELDVGLGFARSEMSGDNLHSIQHHYGPVLRGVLGLTFGITEHFGAYACGGYVYAPVTDNDIGQTHNDGGVTIATGLRLRSLKGVW
jgi:hypothetical protein